MNCHPDVGQRIIECGCIAKHVLFGDKNWWVCPSSSCALPSCALFNDDDVRSKSNRASQQWLSKRNSCARQACDLWSRTVHGHRCFSPPNISCLLVCFVRIALPSPITLGAQFPYGDVSNCVAVDVCHSKMDERRKVNALSSDHHLLGLWFACIFRSIKKKSQARRVGRSAHHTLINLHTYDRNLAATSKYVNLIGDVNVWRKGAIEAPKALTSNILHESRSMSWEHIKRIASKLFVKNKTTTWMTTRRTPSCG